MNKKFLRKLLKLNKKGALTGYSLALLVLLHIPISIRNTAQLACIGQVSHQVWKDTNSHSKANIIAFQKCG